MSGASEGHRGQGQAFLLPVFCGDNSAVSRTSLSTAGLSAVSRTSLPTASLSAVARTSLSIQLSPQCCRNLRENHLSQHPLCKSKGDLLRCPGTLCSECSGVRERCVRERCVRMCSGESVVFGSLCSGRAHHYVLAQMFALLLMYSE